MSARALLPPRLLLACATATLLLAAPAIAGDLGLQEGVFEDPQFDPTIAMDASIGRATGTAHELVYDSSGRKLSELIWQIDGAMLFNAGIDVQVSPWLGFNINGSTLLSGESEMDDYDWFYPGYDWTHWSNSPNTDIDAANRIDLSASLALFRHPNFELSAIAGYRWDQWAWIARGGSYIYSSDGNFRDLVGDFPNDEVGISYKQNWNTPYLGLGLDAHYDRFSFNASVLGSSWVFGEDWDQHHLRGLLFHERMHNGKMWSWSLGGAYQFTEALSLTANYEREQFEEVKGGTTISEIGEGYYGSGGNTLAKIDGPAAGMDNETERYSLGLSYKLN